MKELHGSLNQQVANLAVFFTKVHHFHWFVTGREFFVLHEKFEALYEEVNELYDSFAERLITIGGTPASTMKAYLELTTLKEAKTLDPMKMVEEVVADLTVMIDDMKKLTALAQSLGDEQTTDLCIGTVSSFEKHRWMFHAFQK